MKFTLRPPQIAIMNEFGILSVAPARPATAGSVNNNALDSRLRHRARPSFLECKVEQVRISEVQPLHRPSMIMPQYSHTENPHSRFGIETHRLRFAIRSAFRFPKRLVFCIPTFRCGTGAIEYLRQRLPRAVSCFVEATDRSRSQTNAVASNGSFNPSGQIRENSALQHLLNNQVHPDRGRQAPPGLRRTSSRRSTARWP